MYDDMPELDEFFTAAWENVTAEHGNAIADAVIAHLKKDVYLYWDVCHVGITADNLDHFEGVTALIEFLTAVSETETIAA